MKRGGMIASLLLACIFAAVLLLTLTLGAQVYRNVGRRVDAGAEQRVGLTYLTARLRAFDHAGGVRVGEFGGVPAVLLHEEIEGDAYVTALYVADGALRELFCEDLSAFAPADGAEILPAQALDAACADGLLTLALTNGAGETRTAQICLKSEGCG